LAINPIKWQASHQNYQSRPDSCPFKPGGGATRQKTHCAGENSLFGYVLAGSSYIWPLPTTIKQPQRLTAQINTDKQLWQASSTGLYQ